MRHFPDYTVAKTRREMMQISKRILFEASSRGARFLKKHPIFDVWYIQDDPKAVRDKISHMLRDLKRTAYTTTKTRQENRLGEVTARSMTRGFQGCCTQNNDEEAHRNLMLTAVPMMVESDRDMTKDSRRSMIANFTSFLPKCGTGYYHDSSIISMLILGDDWKPEDGSCVKLSSLDHNAVEEQHIRLHQAEIESLYSVSELILRDDEDWEFLW